MACDTCGIVLCGSTDDLDLFSLQRSVFPFVINCPAGFDCTGLSSFTMSCCGQSIGEVFPNDATLVERIAIIQRVVQRCFVAQLSCAGQIPPTQPNPSGGTSPAGNTPPSTPFALFYNFPQSATVRCPDGQEFTYTAQVGITGASSQAEANRFALDFARRQADAQRICMRRLPEIICFNVARTLTIVADGGGLNPPPTPNFWEITAGAVPTGMTFAGGLRLGSTDQGTALVSGTPSVDGAHAFTARVTGLNGATQSKAYSVCVLKIMPGFLPAVSVGVPYSQMLSVSACAGTAAWDITAGTLPPGLSLDGDTGLISGTPTGADTGPITVKATVVSDDSGNTIDCSDQLAFGSSCITTGDPVPASFLEELLIPDNVQNIEIDVDEVFSLDFAAPAGQYRAIFGGGYQFRFDDLAPCVPPNFPNFGVRTYSIIGIVVSGAGSGSQAGPGCDECYAAPDPTCPQTLDDWDATYFGATMFEFNVLPAQAGDNVNVAGIGLTSQPGAGSSGGSTVWVVERWKEYLVVPPSVTITDFVADMATIVPTDSIGAAGAPVWDGVIDENFYEDEFQVQITMTTPEFVGNVSCTAFVTGDAGMGWTLIIQGSWTTIGGPQSGTLWEGFKGYGVTGAGDYTKTGALRVDAPACLTCTSP